ncbi:MAG: AAA family ATPase [Coriobacteriales bacterium]|nr:AAA family ATPase [Coriobacteriales bacterium]
MKRKLYKQLLDWKMRGSIKPLMLIGARQVGKTWLIREFCKREFGDYLEINLFNRPDIIDLFSEDIAVELKIARLSLYLGRSIDFESTVLFFDEIQESEDAVFLLKYFAESEVPYKIICAGSLLGVKINRFSKPFPVGQVEKLHLYPLDFEEFMIASGEELLVEEIRACYDSDRHMPDPLHGICLERYRSYLCVGGMPAAVSDFVAKGKDVLRFDARILTDIRTDYLSDMTRHIRAPIESTRIEAIYTSLPSQLANQSGKFQYAKVRQGAKNREYYSALDWLVSSEMVFLCPQVTLPSKPLRGFEREGFFKVFLNDCGLLCNALGVLFPDIMLNRDLPFKGIIAENYVATQLVASGHALFYWHSGNEAEVDFLREVPEGVVPLEVKSGDNKRSASLRSYVQTYKPPYSIRLTARNFGYTNKIKSVPLYAAFCIA